MKKLDELEEISKLVLSDKPTADLSQITIQCGHIKEFKKQTTPTIILALVKTIRAQHEALKKIRFYRQIEYSKIKTVIDETEKAWGNVTSEKSE